LNTRSPYLENARLQALQPVLGWRSSALHALRTWFKDEGFTEIETPIRIPTPALEQHIDAEPSGAGFLRTSPELHMKRLLAAGYPRIFQMGPCFRKGERGERHHPEYTMLEWYRAHADYLDILDDTERLITHVATNATFPPCASLSSLPASRTPLASYRHGTPEPFGVGGLPPPPWPRFTVEELFLKHAGWNPVEAYDAERFERDLVARVEPALPRDTPVFVMDYPAAAAALSRRKPGRETVAERFELYIAGIEIANAFSELTDAVEQRRRFEEWAMERRTAGREVYALDEAFLSALVAGMPPAGGIALGVDRLVMALLGKTSLDDVIPFRENI
jgi:lysyl-tRNA synthetase class 2